MGDSVAVEWFGQSSSSVTQPPSDVAKAVTSRLSQLGYRRYTDGLRALLDRSAKTGKDTTDPVDAFIKQYEPVFQEFDRVFTEHRWLQRVASTF